MNVIGWVLVVFFVCITIITCKLIDSRRDDMVPSRYRELRKELWDIKDKLDNKGEY